MHDFGLIDLAGLVAAGWVLVRVLGPVATALARRIERALAARQPPPELPQPRTPV